MKTKTVKSNSDHEAITRLIDTLNNKKGDLEQEVEQLEEVIDALENAVDYLL